MSYQKNKKTFGDLTLLIFRSSHRIPPDWSVSRVTWIWSLLISRIKIKVYIYNQKIQCGRTVRWHHHVAVRQVVSSLSRGSSKFSAAVVQVKRKNSAEKAISNSALTLWDPLKLRKLFQCKGGECSGTKGAVKVLNVHLFAVRICLKLY